METTTWNDIISSVFIFIGVMFIVISGLGLLRFPDFYIRISAVTKAITLGITFILLGIGIHFNDVLIGSKIIAIILFMLLISPISSHIIARVATKNKVPFWERTNLNEFKEYLKEQEMKE